MTIGIRIKLVVSVLAALLMAAAVACALVYHHVEDELGTAAVSEASFVLRQLQAAIEAGLGLGLELEELPGMAVLLERSLNDQDPTKVRPVVIRAVAVFDETGRIVFSSRPAEVDGHIPVAAVPGSTGSAGSAGSAGPAGFVLPVRRTAVGSVLILSLPLATGFGTLAGGVAVEVDREALAQQLVAFGLRLLWLALAVYGVVGAIAAIVTHWIGRDIERRVSVTAEAFQALAEGVATVPDATGPDAAVSDFAAAVRVRQELVAQADADVGRLDEMA